MNRAYLRTRIINLSAQLFTQLFTPPFAEYSPATEADYKQEFKEQFEDLSYNLWLRTALGQYILEGNKKAMQIMKMLIKYNLAHLKDH